MNLNLSQKFLLAFSLALLVPATSFGQCANKLLWTNGSLWAYRAVKCESKTVCNTATGKVMLYDHEITLLGCASDKDGCTCSYTGGDELNATPERLGHTTDPDKAIQNQGCQTIDAFVVKIEEDYFQLIEFRYVPDDTTTDDFGIPVARNMRTAIKLTGEPKQASSNLLTTDSAKIEGDNIVRTLGTTILTYPLLKSGVLTLEELVVQVPETATPQSSVTPEPAAEQTPATTPEPAAETPAAEPAATPEPDDTTPTPDDSDNDDG